MSDAGEAPCWCESGLSRRDCCEPLLLGKADAPTALALMRSRYSAYVTGDRDYLLATWDEATRPDALRLDPEQRWLGLKIYRVEEGGAEDDKGVVEFAARFKLQGRGHRLRELSRFRRHAGRWVYVDGELVS